MLRRINDRLLDTPVSTAVLTAEAQAVTGKGKAIGIDVVCTDLVSLSIYDTTTVVSGTVDPAAKKIIPTYTLASGAGNTYIDLHGQYYSNGIYVDITTAGSLEYTVIYDY